MLYIYLLVSCVATDSELFIIMHSVYLFVSMPILTLSLCDITRSASARRWEGDGLGS